MTTDSTLRFGAQTDEVTSLLRIVNLVRTGEATTRPENGKVTGLSVSAPSRGGSSSAPLERPISVWA
jgi:hypothetical protein